jgi:predicted ATP-grasp superfamily ATP-dependent carboligase
MLPPAGIDPRPRLLIVGCSTRAAAWSAVRAGFRPVCADQFGDEDLRQIAEIVPEPFGARGPQTVAAGLWAVSHQDATSVESLERMSQLSSDTRNSDSRYLGAMLNPSLAAQLFFANSMISHRLRLGDLPHLQVWPAGHITSAVQLPQKAIPTDGTWVVKRSSGGGRNVRVWTAEAAKQPLHDAHILQQYKPGEPMSAIFLARLGGVELLGITQQLIGDSVASPPWPFGYCGNIAPVPLPDAGLRLLGRMADALVQSSGLRGLFGVDFIWDGTTPWIVEVNPRYTAACELLELAYGQPLVSEHWRCFSFDAPPPPPPVKNRRGGLPNVIGKLILYARKAVIAPDLSRFVRSRSPWSVPFLADVPRIGTRFELGQPLCTVFATGRDPESVRTKLNRRAARVRQWFRDADQ